MGAPLALMNTEPGKAAVLSQDVLSMYIAYIDRGQATTRAYLTNLRQFMAFIAYKGIRQPERQTIIDFRDWLLTEHTAIEYAPELPSRWAYRTDKTGGRVLIQCKPATVRAYIQAVKQFFTWAAACGLCQNIAANVHTPQVNKTHKKDSLTPADVVAVESTILKAANEKEQAAAGAKKDRAGRLSRSTEQGKRLYAMYLLAVNCGLRTVEISRANIGDVELKGGQAYIYIWGKGHSEADQKKPIAKEVYKALRQYMDTKGKQPSSAPLFTATGNRSKGKRLAPTTISTMLKEALKAAGYNSERITAHSLRHTAGQNVLAVTGQNIYLTQGYLRHSSPATTEIYLDGTSTEQEATIAEKLYTFYHAGAASN